MKYLCNITAPYFIKYKLSKKQIIVNLKKIYLLPAVLFASMNANAAMVNFELVDYADTDNAFRLSVDDFIFAYGRFDDSLLVGSGYESVSLGFIDG